LAITNRLDIVKKDQTSRSGGEGRFVFGYTGFRPLTVIFEYNLPIGAASNKAMTLNTWAQEWHGLKRFLKDTDTSKSGVQPDPETLQFRDKNGYLAALEALTKKTAVRDAQKRDAALTAAAISQVRTNEFIESPWELREMSRVRPASGGIQLQLTTVKDNPDINNFASSGSQHDAFKKWISSNVTCTGSNPNSCKYTTPSGGLPEAILVVGKQVPLIGASAPNNFGDWDSGFTSTKEKFMAGNTCSGCHGSKTDTFFVHIDNISGAPSQFLIDDLVRRVKNLKNLICRAAVAPPPANPSSIFSGP
jgi:hypothetical protein